MTQPITRVAKTVTRKPQMRIGFGGNIYVISSSKLELIAICEELNLSPRLIYDSQHHDCFVLRVRKPSNKMKVKAFFKRDLS